MIPRQEVQGFDLIRWARNCSRGEFELREPRGEYRRLTSREAHLLVVLATYAGKDCKCWPSLKTLADDMCLKAHLVTRARGRGGADVVYWRCSTVSAALDGLQALGLLWTVQGGRGRKAVRQLLYDMAVLEAAIKRAGPGVSSVSTEDKPEAPLAWAAAVSSSNTEDEQALSSVRPVLSSVSPEGNYQENCSEQLPAQRPNSQRMSSADAEDKPSLHTEDKAEDSVDDERDTTDIDEQPLAVRAAIAASLEAARPAA